jgi:hypothetical protein
LFTKTNLPSDGRKFCSTIKIFPTISNQ